MVKCTQQLCDKCRRLWDKYVTTGRINQVENAEIVGGIADTKARTTGAQLRDDLEEREKWPKKARKNLHRRHTQAESEPVSVQLECPPLTAKTETGALPLSKRRCMITGT